MSDTPVRDETLAVINAETQVDELMTPDADPATMPEQPAHEVVLVVSPDTDPAVAVESDAGTIERTHPTIAMQIIFDGNVLNIPVGTPSEMLENDAVLRRAYSISMGMPALLKRG